MLLTMFICSRGRPVAARKNRDTALHIHRTVIRRSINATKIHRDQNIFAASICELLDAGGRVSLLLELCVKIRKGGPQFVPPFYLCFSLNVVV
jgi:hypothetical protein